MLIGPVVLSFWTGSVCNAFVYWGGGDYRFAQGCILAGISFLSISSILLSTRKSGIRRDKYLSAAIFKEAVHSDDS